MKAESPPPDDSFQVRCPKLGHQIHFTYCRAENSGLPCFRTLACWYPYFQVEVYLRQELSPEEWHQTFETPVKPKVHSLMELIDQVQKRKKEKGGS